MDKPVNFELAKLLKEKEFRNFGCKIYHTENELRDFPNIPKFYPEAKSREKIYEEVDIYLAPTIAEVVMWLYEKHNIWVGVMRDKEVGAVAEDPYYFTYDYGRHIYNTPIEAYEAVIDFYLNNLR